jgi:hypothetical protein
MGILKKYFLKKYKCKQNTALACTIKHNGFVIFGKCADFIASHVSFLLSVTERQA